MPEEAQAPATDTPTESAPVEDTQTPVVDWEQRYTHLRPEFDRTKQQLRELEEEREQLLAAQQQAQPEFDDEYVDYDDRIDRLEALISQQDQRWQEHQDTLAQEQQAELETQFVNDNIETLEKEIDEEFTDEEWNTIGILSERYRDEEGRPDVRFAYEQLFGKIVNPRREKYVTTKKSPKVNSGPAAAQSIDLDDPKTRREYLNQKFRELEGDQ